MKTTLILAIGILATAVSGQVGPPLPEIPADHDGQPGCATRFEFRRLWRNNLVPEQYWECRQWQEPARVRYCPVATRFLDSWQTCVPYEQWLWTPYLEPPTRPFNAAQDECEELVLIPDECYTQATTPNPTTQTTTEQVTGGSTPSPTTTTAAPPVVPTEAPQENRQCIGANNSQHWPGWVDCDRPPSSDSCNIYNTHRRIPTRDPYVYFQCTWNFGWVEMRCTNFTCFDTSRSFCVVPQAWRQGCRA